MATNFHSICDKSYSLNSKHHCFAFTSQLDFNGSAFYYNSIAAKHNKIADFYALRPTLPHFINRSRLHNRYAAKSCLLFCKNGDKNLLISTDKNKIFGLLLKDNKLSNIGESAQNNEFQANPHIYSTDQSVSYGPFRYYTQEVCDLYIDSEEDFRPIYELKVNELDENEIQIQTNSRNKICFFDFSDDNSDLSLDPINELKIENFQRNDKSLFECCDRNQLICNQLLISFTKDNIIDLYDLESNQTIRSFKSKSHRLKSKKQIGLNWCPTHPTNFFYGEHNVLKCVDSRSKKSVIDFFTSDENKNSFNWEKFYKFLPSKLKPYQVFVATDYHIFVTDLRFPKQNLIQLKHMLHNTVVRSLKSLEVLIDGIVTEVLISSNFHRNCLMSFTSSEYSISHISNHLPIHLSTPKDIDKRFENYFFRGEELINSTDGSGFSLALLTSFGDIFLQDLFWSSVEELESEDKNRRYRDRTFCSGFGSSNLQLDYKTDQYMNAINKFLYQLKIEDMRPDYHSLHVSNHDCLNCSVNRVCKLEGDECQCRHFSDFATDFDIIEEDYGSDRTQFMRLLFEKHLHSEIAINYQKLKNPELLLKTTDKYTKNILEEFDLGD